MKDSFESFLFQKLEVDRQSKFILAVSAGMDSMCMWDLFRKSKLNYIIAHCNFKLRKEASDLDEQFVKNYAEEGELVFTTSFETKKYAKEKSISIQMAARELRYDWFENLRQKQHIDFIATAHHLDDQVETFFIQLLRKSALPGLSGIPLRKNKIVRPMMFVGRESIENYVSMHNIEYREDESNASDVYLRNKIRRNLIPVLQKVLPDFKLSVLEVMGNMKEISEGMSEYFDRKKIDLIRKKDEENRIRIQELQGIEFPLMFLEYYLKSLGFNQTVARNLYEALDSESGKTFYSSQYRIIKDRYDLIILPLVLKIEDEIRLSKHDLLEENEFFIQGKLVQNEKNLLKKASSTMAYLDFDKLNDEILMRKWRHGDYFFPLGLGGKKKISDYFIDRKLSISDKENQWIMLSGEDICWIVGQGIDDRFKIRDNTAHVLILEQQ